MSKPINLRPLQTGDACYLTDHHNRDGECIVTVTMHDGCTSMSAALASIRDAIDAEERIPTTRCDAPSMRGTADCAAWCAAQWLLAQADMPAETDRDTTGGDQSERYLECHILASWEV